jgi:hypothetical protein
VLNGALRIFHLFKDEEKNERSFKGALSLLSLAGNLKCILWMLVGAPLSKTTYLVHSSSPYLTHFISLLLERRRHYYWDTWGASMATCNVRQDVHHFKLLKGR